MKVFNQFIVLSQVAVESFPSRLGVSLVTIVGVAGVTAVLVSMLSLATGLMKTLSSSGHPDRAIVLSEGSKSEAVSGLSREDVNLILSTPGLRKNADHNAIGSADMVTSIFLSKRDDGRDAYVPLRGVGGTFFELHPEITIKAGRRFNPGLNEVIVGRLAHSQYRGVEVGDHIKIRGGDWLVTGLFESGGSSRESEVIGDAEALLSTYKSRFFQSVTALLDSPAGFEAFKSSVEATPALSATVMRESDYYARRSANASSTIFFAVYVIGLVMSIGAIFGALNTMYSVVGSRAVEIATLRAIGFNYHAILCSILVEALGLALIGALFGIGFSWLLFDGIVAATPEVVVPVQVTPGNMLSAAALAGAIGLLGGLIPALHSLRKPIAAELRA